VDLRLSHQQILATQELITDIAFGALKILRATGTHHMVVQQSVRPTQTGVAVLTAEALGMVGTTQRFKNLREDTLVAGVAVIRGLDAVLAHGQSLLIQADRVFGGREQSATLRATEAIFMIALAAHHQMTLIQDATTTSAAWCRVAVLAEECVTQEGAIGRINVAIALATAVAIFVEGTVEIFILVPITHWVAAAGALWMRRAIVLALNHHKERRVQRLGALRQLACEAVGMPVGTLSFH